MGDVAADVTLGDTRPVFGGRAVGAPHDVSIDGELFYPTPVREPVQFHRFSSPELSDMSLNGRARVDWVLLLVEPGSKVMCAGGGSDSAGIALQHW